MVMLSKFSLWAQSEHYAVSMNSVSLIIGLFYLFDTWYQLMSFLMSGSVMVLILLLKCGHHSRLGSQTMSMMTIFNNSIKSITSSVYFNGWSLQMLVMVVLIMVMNFSSLFGYVVPITSMIQIILMIAVLHFIQTMMISFNSISKTITHLSLMSVPVYLMMFLSTIEVISLLIRPLTLSVRLSANITAGHILMSLINWLSFSWLFYSSFVITVMLMCLEILVCLVQSVIFIMLVSLYMSDSS